VRAFCAGKRRRPQAGGHGAERSHNLAPVVMLRAVALTALVALVGTTASAMTIREMRALEVSNKKQGEAYVNYYLVGVMEGAMEAHAQDVRKGAQPSICLNGRRLLPSMARSLFDTELQRNEGVYEADMAVQLVLTNALATVYPC
jgi:hypothetical protein